MARAKKNPTPASTKPTVVAMAKTANPTKVKAVRVRAEGESASIVPIAKRQEYAANGGSCGDAFAEAFAEAVQTPKSDKSKKSVLDLENLERVAEANGVDFAKYSHLNPGQQRMNVGNVLRGKAYAGETVKVGGVTFDLTGAIKRAKAKTKSDVLDDYDVDSILEMAGLPFSPRGHTAVAKIFKSLAK